MPCTSFQYSTQYIVKCIGNLIGKNSFRLLHFRLDQIETKQHENKNMDIHCSSRCPTNLGCWRSLYYNHHHPPPITKPLPPYCLHTSSFRLSAIEYSSKVEVVLVIHDLNIETHFWIIFIEFVPTYFMFGVALQENLFTSKFKTHSLILCRWEQNFRSGVSCYNWENFHSVSTLSYLQTSV